MLNSGKKNWRLARQKKKNILSLVLSEKKILNETKNHNPSFKLNGRSLKMGRQTIYALLGSGLHARSGMSPLVLMKIWNTYVVPRFLYGLEVQNPTKQILKSLNNSREMSVGNFSA